MAKRDAERRAAVEAVQEAKHKSLKMEAVAPKQLYGEKPAGSSEDEAKSSGSSDEENSTPASCASGAPKSEQLERKQAPTKGERQSQAKQQSGKPLNTCSDNVPRGELRKMIAGN